MIKNRHGDASDENQVHFLFKCRITAESREFKSSAAVHLSIS